MIDNFFNKKVKVSGFTLVEILVYLALFIIITTTSVGFLFSLNDLVDQYRIETVLYRSGSNVMEQILLSIRQADNVDLLNTVEDDPDNGQLAVVDGSGVTTQYVFSGGELQMNVDGNSLGSLTNTTVNVDTFTVYYYSLGDGELVRVRLELTGSTEGVTKSITLQSGAVIRGAL